MKRIKFRIGNLRSHVEGEEIPADILDKATSCYKTGYQFSPAFNRRVSGGKRAWDGKIHLYNVAGRLLPTGIVHLATAALQKAGYEVRYSFTPDAALLPIKNTIGRELGGLHPRTHQIEATTKILVGGPIGQKGVVRLPTGTGKTLCGAMIFDALDEPGIFLVHGQNLVDQTTREMKRFLGNSRVGLLMAEDYFPGKFLVASVDTLASRILRKDPRVMMDLEHRKILIADEAHRVGGGAATFQRAMDACPASVRVGMSGTPLKKIVDVDLLLMSRTGPLLYDLQTSACQTAGLLAKAELKVYEIGGEARNDFTWREAMEYLVYRRNKRTAFIVSEIMALALQGRKILIVGGNSVVFVKRLEEAWDAEVIRQLSLGTPRRTIPSARFVTGTSGRETVNGAVAALRKGKIQVLCSTVIFDEGTDVPDLDVVVLAAPIKSYVKVMQRIGRGLRPKNTPLLVMDFFDSCNSYLVKHFYSRLSVYEQEGLFDSVEFLTPELGPETLEIEASEAVSDDMEFGEEDLATLSQLLAPAGGAI